MELTSQLLPSFLVVLVTAAFFVAERVWPGRRRTARGGTCARSS